MGKKARNTMVWITAFIIFILSILVLVNLPVKGNDDDDQHRMVMDLTFNDYSANDVISVKIKNRHDEYTVNSDNGECYIDKLLTLPTSQTKFSALLADCSGVAATQIVDPDTSDLSVFGLVNPKIVVEVLYADGTPLNLYIGNDDTENAGVYVCEAGKSRVYTFSNAKVDTFFYTLNDYIYEYITEPVKQGQTLPVLSKLTLGGTVRSSEVATEQDSAGSYSVKNAQFSESANQTVVSDYSKELLGFKSTSVVKFNPTNDDYTKYGLSSPYSTINAVYTDRSFTLYISKADSEKNIYVMKKDLAVIYKVNACTKNVITAQFEDIAQKTVITAPLNTVKTLTLNFDKKDYRFDLSYSSDGTLQSVSYSGKGISLTDFTAFYNNLKSMSKQKFVSETSADKTALLSCTFTYTNEEIPNDVISFLGSSSPDFALININGSCNSCEKTAFVNKLIDDCKRLISGQTVSTVSSQSTQSSSSVSSTTSSSH